MKHTEHSFSKPIRKAIPDKYLPLKNSNFGSIGAEEGQRVDLQKSPIFREKRYLLNSKYRAEKKKIENYKFRDKIIKPLKAVYFLKAVMAIQPLSYFIKWKNR